MLFSRAYFTVVWADTGNISVGDPDPIGMLQM